MNQLPVSIQSWGSMTRFEGGGVESWVMDRAEAEAVYDAGREACVEFLLELTSGYDAQIARLEERLRRLEEPPRRDSRMSSKPPSSDPPKTR